MVALLVLACQSNLPFRTPRVMTVFTKGVVGHKMQMETKFLRLRTPVELGSRFGDWQVCWLGGWARFRLYFLVMLVKVPLPCVPVVAGILVADRTIDLAFGEKRAMNGVAMNTFTIDTNNNITAFASLDDARAAKIHHAEYFGSPQELAKLVASWPGCIGSRPSALDGETVPSADTGEGGGWFTIRRSDRFMKAEGGRVKTSGESSRAF
jgi:hypothetical protein